MKSSLTFVLGIILSSGSFSSFANESNPTNNFAKPPITLSQERVTFSWALDPKESLQNMNSENFAESKEYWLETNGEKLAQGIELPISSPGAIVRISATGRNGKAIEPNQLKLIKQGKNAAMGLQASSSALAQVDKETFRGMSAFSINESEGKGTFLLQTKTPQNSSDRYLVSVFEKNSPNTLELSANAFHYAKNDTLTLKADVFQASIKKIEAKLISPSGREYPLPVRQHKGEWKVSYGMKMAEQSNNGQLWELRTSVIAALGEETIMRNAKVAFAYVIPTAEITQQQVINKNKQLQGVKFDLHIKQEGRYEVRAALYGSDKAGELKPIMMSHTADYLKSGRNNIILDFDQNILSASELSAPYELKFIQLMDQGRMSIQQKNINNFRMTEK